MAEKYGYAGQILRVDLSAHQISTIPTKTYAARFLGGRGIAAKIYWDEVPPETRAFEPENRLIFVTGPLADVSPGVAGVRWLVCGKSPATTPEQFSYSNLGGSCTKGAYVSTDVLIATAKKFWGTELAVDLSTYEGKAQTAARIQDRRYAHESLILCDWSWPILTVEFSDDHVGDPSLDSKVLSAVLGETISEEALYKTGERIVNLQRAIHAKEARGSDTLPDFHFITPMRTDPTNPTGVAPGKNGEIIQRKGAVLDRDKFDAMRKEYYGIRGWDTDTGLQTKAKLSALDLVDVAEALEKQGLAV